MADLFEDPQFPATLDSIYYDGRANPGLEWKRPKEICDDPIFISDAATKYDIAQGGLSDCWFLSAAAVLATRQELFSAIVPEGQDFGENYTGKFRFRFWRFGKWEEIEIDDRLPTRNNKLYFCYNRGTPNEFWSALLEKAYAKVHKSYQAMNNGFGQDALVDLTGGIGEFIDLNGKIGVKNAETEDLIPKNRAKLFKRLKRLVKKKSSFLCSAVDVKENGEFEATLDSGLVTGHAYSICEIDEKPIADGMVWLVKLRNPWGFKEWNGSWSDGSSEWDQLSDEVKAEMSPSNHDEGEFWMNFDDFVVNFDNVSLCHLTPDSVHDTYGESLWHHADYHGLWAKGATAGGCFQNPGSYWMNPQYYVRLRDPDEDEDNKCTLVVSLMQKYTRVRKTVEKTTDTEVPIGFDLFKYTGDEPEELTGFHATQAALHIKSPMTDFDYLRERSKRYDLSPGTYCIIPSTFEPDTEGSFLLRLAFETSAESGEVEDPSGHDGSISSTKFDRLYDKHAGDDEVIDARELRKLLNDGMKREQDEEFTKETCRALIKSVIGDHRGTLVKSDMENVWETIKRYQSTFDQFDKDGSLSLNIRELRGALKSIGVRMSKQTLADVAQKYCGQSEQLSFDEFVLIATKITATSDSFENARSGRSGRSGSGRKLELSLDEVLQMTL